MVISHIHFGSQKRLIPNICECHSMQGKNIVSNPKPSLTLKPQLALSTCSESVGLLQTELLCSCWSLSSSCVAASKSFCSSFWRLCSMADCSVAFLACRVKKVESLLNGSSPFPCLFSLLKGKRLKFLKIPAPIGPGTINTQNSKLDSEETSRSILCILTSCLVKDRAH